MKHIVLLFSGLLMVTLLSAQVELKPAIGINVLNASKDPVDGEVKGKVGWQLGGSAEFGNKVYGELGFFYVQESSEITTATNPEAVDFKSKGFRIPLSVGWNVLGSMESDFNLHIQGGGSAYFISGTDGIQKEDLETTQWGVFAGAGVDLWILFIDVKYEWSLTDVSGITEFDIGKTHGLFANAGVRIRI